MGKPRLRERLNDLPKILRNHNANPKGHVTSTTLWSLLAADAVGSGFWRGNKMAALAAQQG
jgi:hypothetical protein